MTVSVNYQPLAQQQTKVLSCSKLNWRRRRVIKLIREAVALNSLSRRGDETRSSWRWSRGWWDGEAVASDRKIAFVLFRFRRNKSDEKIKKFS